MQEAVVIILDVGATMSASRREKEKEKGKGKGKGKEQDHDQEEATPLEGALKAVNLLIQQKLSFLLLLIHYS